MMLTQNDRVNVSISFSLRDVYMTHHEAHKLNFLYNSKESYVYPIVDLKRVMVSLRVKGGGCSFGYIEYCSFLPSCDDYSILRP